MPQRSLGGREKPRGLPHAGGALEQSGVPGGRRMPPLLRRPVRASRVRAPTRPSASALAPSRNGRGRHCVRGSTSFFCTVGLQDRSPELFVGSPIRSICYSSQKPNSESGGIGRRARLRISWGSSPVGVRVPPFAPPRMPLNACKRQFEGRFLFGPVSPNLATNRRISHQTEKLWGNYGGTLPHSLQPPERFFHCAVHHFRAEVAIHLRDLGIGVPTNL